MRTSAVAIVFLLVLLLMEQAPGDPFSHELGLKAEVKESLQSYWKLDRPWHERVIFFATSPTISQSRTPLRLIYDTFPVSFQLGIQALLLAFPIGVALGVMQRARLAALLAAIPPFAVAGALQYFFAIKWHLFPIAGWGTFAQTLLPTIALALFPIAAITRLISAQVDEKLESEHIFFVRTLGFSEGYILLWHVLPSCLLALLGYTGQLVVHIFSGSFIVERIFGIPGMGQWLVESLLSRDYPLIAFLALFYAILLIGTQGIFENLYRRLTPCG